MDTLFRSIDGYPGVVSSGNVLARLVAGVGFRFYWATEGLKSDALGFRPSPAVRSFGEILEHIERLAALVSASLGAEQLAAPDMPDGVARREHILRVLELVHDRLARISDAELAACTIRGRGPDMPFWNLINGPIADILTHVGQINSWRTIGGIPVPRANPLRGLPPAPEKG